MPLTCDNGGVVLATGYLVNDDVEAARPWYWEIVWSLGVRVCEKPELRVDPKLPMAVLTPYEHLGILVVLGRLSMRHSIALAEVFDIFVAHIVSL